MDIRAIAYRTFGKPFFDMQESNAILDYLRQALFSRKNIQSSYGSIPLSDYVPDSSINVKFTSSLPPHSVFGVKYVDRQFYKPIAVADVDLAITPATQKQNQAFIYCTNGGVKTQNGMCLDCQIFGYSKPLLVAYTGTTPVFGQRMAPVGSPTNKFEVKSSGQFVSASLPNTVESVIYVIRHSKSEFVYGKAASAITYGSSGTLNIYRGEAITNPLETETVRFTWEGIAGQVIPAGANMTARWIADLQTYRVHLSNCVAS